MPSNRTICKRRFNFTYHSAKLYTVCFMEQIILCIIIINYRSRTLPCLSTVALSWRILSTVLTIYIDNCWPYLKGFVDALNLKLEMNVYYLVSSICGSFIKLWWIEVHPGYSTEGAQNELFLKHKFNLCQKILTHSRICSTHFPFGNSWKKPKAH